MVKILAWVLCPIGVGFLVPEPKVIPVAAATSNDWNPNTFWYEPWGSSGVHKGIDVFADRGADVLAPTHMLVVYRGAISKGGNIVVGLGPKWRLHYFAHLNSFDEQAGRFLSAGASLGEVGDTGNAKGKPAHLHYSIISLLPVPWRIDSSTQGFKKAFYLNPIEYLSSAEG